MDTTTSNNDESHEVSPEIVRQVRAVLAELLAGEKVPVPPALEGLPVELLLERILPTAVAAELLSLTPETLLTNPEYRAQLIPLTGKKFGMRLRDALKLKPKGGRGRKRKPART